MDSKVLRWALGTYTAETDEENIELMGTFLKQVGHKPPLTMEDVMGVIEALERQNAALRRDAQRSHVLLAAALPEAERNLRALLAERVKESREFLHGEIRNAAMASEFADMVPVDGWLIDHLLQLIQEEATRKLANLEVPRMIVETKGEAEAIVAMMQKERTGREEAAKTQAHEAARLARELASAMKALSDQTLKLDDAWYQMRETKKLLAGIVQAYDNDPNNGLHLTLVVESIKAHLGKHPLKDDPSRQPG